MGTIETLHTAVYNLVDAVSGFNQGFYEKPKEITDEKLPAFVVYLEGYENEMSSMRTNKRTYTYAVDIIYDKEDLDTTQTVISDLVSSVVEVLEGSENFQLGGANFTRPTSCKRIDDYVVAGKHYLAYQIVLPIICNEVI
ncbi:MAG: hypothetical protein AB9866_19020 [Syntrophobacteraceae bacterium]